MANNIYKSPPEIPFEAVDAYTRDSTPQKLKKLVLDDNPFMHLNKNSFIGYSGLSMLSLSNVNLTTLSAHLLSKLDALEELDLSRNKFSVVNHNSLPLRIKYLDLSKNSRLLHLSHDYLKNSTLLELMLNDCRILDVSLLNNLPVTMEKIWLYNNNWSCECYLTELDHFEKSHLLDIYDFEKNPENYTSTG